MRTRMMILLGAIYTWALCSTGCTAETPEVAPAPDPDLLPTIIALDHFAVPLGTSVGVYGANFYNEPNEFHYRPMPVMRLEGVFEAHDGFANQVSTEITLARGNDGRLIWDDIGPFEHPFSNRAVVGRFSGTAQLIFYDVDADGLATEPLAEGRAQAFEFEILPSIFIRAFHPVSADCPDPVPTALPSLPYRIEAEAVGFDADSFRFELFAHYPNQDDGVVLEPPPVAQVDVPAVGNLGIGGEGGSFRTPPMPAGASQYVLEIQALAYATDGRVIRSNAAMVVHNPIVNYRLGTRHLAQTYEPLVQGSCHEGGIATVNIDYRETQSETRTVSTSNTYSSTWGSSVSSGRSEALGETESDSASYTTSQDSSSATSNSTTLSHEGSVELSWKWEWMASAIFAASKSEIGVKLGYKFGYSTNLTRSIATSQGRSRSQERSIGTSRTSTESETLSRNLTEAQTRAETRTVSSTEATSEGYSAPVFPGTTAVWYRQASRYVTDGIVVRYSLCGAEEVIGNSEYEDWSWTVDIAYGTSCSPLPPPDNLGPARCYVSRCD